MIYIRIAADGEGEIDLSRLPQSSIEKIARKKTEKAKKETLLGEWVKNSLFELLNVTGAEFTYGEHGKPRLIGYENLSYNISHSGNVALGAIMTEAIGCEIGVDVEMIDRNADGKRMERIAKRFFTENERNSILNADDPTAEFYRIWTLKESYIKYTGEGLSRPLKSYDVILGVPDVYMTSEVIFDGEGNEYSFSLCVPCAKKNDSVDKKTI